MSESCIYLVAKLALTSDPASSASIDLSKSLYFLIVLFSVIV